MINLNEARFDKWSQEVKEQVLGHPNTYLGAQHFGLDNEDPFTEIQKGMIEGAVAFVSNALAQHPDNMTIISFCKAGINRSGLMAGWLKKKVLRLDLLPLTDMLIPTNPHYMACLTELGGLDVDVMNKTRLKRKRSVEHT